MCPETPVGRPPHYHARVRGTEALPSEQPQGGEGVSAPPVASVIASRLAAQVARSPDAVAVIAADGTFTYAELADRVGALAAGLAAAGAGRDRTVGIAVDRTSDLVVAVWACLTLGAPYVPLDPAYPSARLSLMTEDAGVAMLVADELGRQTMQLAVPVVDPRTAARDDARVTEVVPAVAERDLAYVIYTSGSTGTPKGVQIDHGNLAHFLDAMDAAVLTPPSGRIVFLASTTLSFDPSVVELIWALVHGATVVLAPSLAGPVAHRASLGTLIERHGVTHAQLTPSRARVLLGDADECRALRHLHQVFVGGEVLTPQLAAELREAGIDVVTNLYGPTETTVWAFAHHVTDEPGAIRERTVIPVGTPLPGYPVRLCDELGAEIGVDALGELRIGGGGVSRGYRNRHELNADRFVDDEVLGRVYRTGDLLRRRPDGAFDFAGRADDQVKVEGYRIELGEVEAALAGCPGTEQIVVAARGDGERRLVAYVLPATDAEVTLSAVRAHGATKLPSYMLPTALVVVDAFDLTPSGKVDRGRLPDPPAPAAVDDDAPVAAAAPHGTPEVQALLQAWWSELLDRRSVGVDDDFFDLGGDSTLAVRLLARVHRELGVRLGLAAIIGAPTVAQLARRIVEAAAGASAPAGACLVEFHRSGSGHPLVCVHGAGGNVLNMTAMARHLADVRPFVGVQARGVDGTSEPDPSITAMAERYVRELRAYQPDGPYLLGGYSGGGVVAIEMARQLRADGAEVPVVLLFDSYPPGMDEPTLREKFVNIARNARVHGVWAVARSLSHIVQRRWKGELVAGAGDLGYGDVSELGLANLDTRFNAVARAHRATPADVHAVLLRTDIIHASHPPLPDWSALLRRRPDERVVPGHHYSMFAPEHAADLARAVEEVLAAVDR